MTSIPQTFADLIEPVDPDEFARRYWEEKPLPVERRNPAFFAGLVTCDDFEAILSRRDARYPQYASCKASPASCTGVYDIHFHPVEPLSARFTLNLSF